MENLFLSWSSILCARFCSGAAGLDPGSVHVETAQVKKNGSGREGRKGRRGKKGREKRRKREGGKVLCVGRRKGRR